MQHLTKYRVGVEEENFLPKKRAVMGHGYTIAP
jgi:hypothetical protein